MTTTSDVDLSVSALVHAAEDIDRNRRDRRGVTARVITFARLLRRDPILAAALRDLSEDEASKDRGRVEEIGSQLLREAEREFYELGDLYRDKGEPWQQIVDSLTELIAKPHTTQATLAEVLDRVATVFRAREPAGLTLGELTAFGTNVIPRLETALKDVAASQARVARGHLANLTRLGIHATKHEVFLSVAAADSPQRVAERFATFLETWESLLRAGPSHPAWAVPDPTGLEDVAVSLASRVRQYLNRRRSRRLVLFRAKVYFEHFIHGEVRDALRAEEGRAVDVARKNGKRPHPERERIIRTFFDRFVFHEGFFPITEATASRGRLDLLIAEADATGLPPLLAEIKQATNIADDDVCAKDVANAITSAAGELDRYRGHVQGRRGWEGVEPFIVVFHTSGESTDHLRADGIVLIDIGTRRPSKLEPAALDPQGI